MTPVEVITEAVWAGGGTREAAEDCARLAVEFLNRQGYVIVGPNPVDTPPAVWPEWFLKWTAKMAAEHPNG